MIDSSFAYATFSEQAAEKSMKFELGYFGGNMQALECKYKGFQVLITAEDSGDAPTIGKPYRIGIFEHEGLEWSYELVATIERKRFNLTQATSIAKREVEALYRKQVKESEKSGMQFEVISTGGGCYGLYTKHFRRVVYITKMMEGKAPVDGDQINISIYDNDFEEVLLGSYEVPVMDMKTLPYKVLQAFNELE